MAQGRAVCPRTRACPFEAGNVERHDGDSAAAEQAFARARAVLEAVEAPDAQSRSRLGAVLTQQAAALFDLKKNDVALPLLERRRRHAVNSRRQQRRPPMPTRRRSWLSESLWELARAYRSAGNMTKAARCRRAPYCIVEGSGGQVGDPGAPGDDSAGAS